MNNRILHVGVSSIEEDLAQFAQVCRDVKVGKRVKPISGIGFADAAQLLAALTPQRCALIYAIKDLGACSIYALAKHLARNYSNVRRDVTKLLELGIAEKDSAGKVFVPWDIIDVQFQVV